ncbi:MULTISPECIES: hypothetical protein [Falsihalocynthiibacter]|uniref:hypothetical protein n=1 Tax=Falsihalocynthiibacter TaxID=2854182 RepID=UPI003003372B
MKLLYLSTRVFQYFWPAKMREDFSDDVAFQAADDLTFAFAVFGAFSGVVKQT